MSEPIHHSVYTALIQNGMPEGLDGEQQALWVRLWCQDAINKRRVLESEIAQLQHDKDVLMDCRRGTQWCNECPDLECVDNLKAVESRVNDE